MNRNRLIYTILTAAAAAASLAAAVFLWFALTDGYDPAIHHFAEGSFPAVGAAVSVILALLAGLAAGIVRAKDDTTFVHTAPSAFGMFAASCTAFMMLASFILNIKELSAGIPILRLLQFLLLAFSAAYFFLCAVRETRGGNAIVLLSLCPMLYAVVSLLTVYFDSSYGMNSPMKSYLLVMHIAMALFFSAEARAVIRRPSPLMYTFFAAVCMTLTATVSLPQLAIALSDLSESGISVMDCAICLSVCLYAASRLISAGRENAADNLPGKN